MSDLVVVIADPQKQTPLDSEVVPDPFDLEQQLELESTEDANPKCESALPYIHDA